MIGIRSFIIRPVHQRLQRHHTESRSVASLLCRWYAGLFLLQALRGEFTYSKMFRLALTICVDGWIPIDLNWTLTRSKASGWQQSSDSQHSRHTIWESADQSSSQPKEHVNLRIFWLQVRSEVRHFQHLSNMLFPTSTVANNSTITAAGYIKDTVTCLWLLSVRLLQFPTSVWDHFGFSCCCQLFWTLFVNIQLYFKLETNIQ